MGRFYSYFPISLAVPLIKAFVPHLRVLRPSTFQSDSWWVCFQIMFRSVCPKDHFLSYLNAFYRPVILLNLAFHKNETSDAQVQLSWQKNNPNDKRAHIFCRDRFGPKQTEVPIPDAECEGGSSDSSKSTMCNAHRTERPGGASILVVTNVADLAIDSFMKTTGDGFFYWKTILGFKEKVYLKTFPPFFTFVVQICTA